MQDLNITIRVYTASRHGHIPARRVMKELGFTHVYVVPQQELPDGDFPTVSYPNPEAKEAFELGLALAKKRKMPTWFWQPIWMPIVWARTSKIPSPANTFR